MTGSERWFGLMENDTMESSNWANEMARELLLMDIRRIQANGRVGLKTEKELSLFMEPLLVEFGVVVNL